MNNYFVYTTFTLGEKDYNIMVTNIESKSLCSAEHVLLDNFYFITNALAFDVNDPTEHFQYHLKESKIMSLSEFRIRYNKIVAQAQFNINNSLNYVENLKSKIQELAEKIKELDKEIEEINSETKAHAELFGLNPNEFTPAEKIEKAINDYKILVSSEMD